MVGKPVVLHQPFELTLSRSGLLRLERVKRTQRLARVDERIDRATSQRGGLLAPRFAGGPESVAEASPKDSVLPLFGRVMDVAQGAPSELDRIDERGVLGCVYAYRRPTQLTGSPCPVEGVTVEVVQGDDFVELLPVHASDPRRTSPQGQLGTPGPRAGTGFDARWRLCSLPPCT